MQAGSLHRRWNQQCRRPLRNIRKNRSRDEDRFIRLNQKYLRGKQVSGFMSKAIWILASKCVKHKPGPQPFTGSAQMMKTGPTFYGSLNPGWIEFVTTFQLLSSQRCLDFSAAAGSLTAEPSQQSLNYGLCLQHPGIGVGTSDRSNSNIFQIGQAIMWCLLERQTERQLWVPHLGDRAPNTWSDPLGFSFSALVRMPGFSCIVHCVCTMSGKCRHSCLRGSLPVTLVMFTVWG